MKKITIILLGFIALLAVSCDKDDHLAPDKSKYVYDIPQTDLPVDAIVGAYYTNITSSSSWLKSGKKYMPVLLCWVNICLQLVECYSNSLLGRMRLPWTF